MRLVGPSILLLTLQGACMDFARPRTTGADEATLSGLPKVIGTSPVDGAVDVAVSGELVIVFSRAMDPQRMDIAAIPPIDFSLATWDQDDERVTFTFNSPLSFSTLYAVTISGRDAAGTSLAETAISFTTVAAPFVPPPPGPPSAAMSTLVSISSPIANGVDAALVTLHCRDEVGTACLAGVMASIASSDPQDTIVSSTGNTDASGEIIFEVKSTKAGTRTLTVTFEGLTLTLSVTFLPGPAYKLVFISSPQEQATTLLPIADVTVAIMDAFDNLTSAEGTDVTLSLTNAGTLGGAATQASAAGTATFSGLTINRADPAQSLHATAAALLAADSAPFAVVAWRQSPTDFRGELPEIIEKHPGSPVIYTGSEGRVFRSDDGGSSFVSRSIGLPEKRICALAYEAGDPQVAYAGTEGDGLYRSIDGGQSWAKLPAPAAPYVCAIVAPATNLVVAGAGDDSGTQGTGVYKSMNRGVDFSAGTGGIEAFPVLDISLGGGAYYAASSGGGIFKSADAAAWSQVANGLPSLYQRRVTVHPSNSNIAYCGAGSSTMRKTVDGGALWTAMSGGPFANIVRLRSSDSSVWIGTLTSGVWTAAHAASGFTDTSNGLYDDNDVWDVAAVPSDESEVLILNSTIQRSTDQGATWQAIAPSPEPPSSSRLAVYHFGATHAVYLVSSSGVVMRSTTGGAPWYSMNIGVTDGIWDLALIGNKPWVISSSSTGAYRWQPSLMPEQFEPVTSDRFFNSLTSDSAGLYFAYGPSGVSRASMTADSFTDFSYPPPEPLNGVVAGRFSDFILGWSGTQIHRTLASGTAAWTTELTTAEVYQVVSANDSVAYAATGTGGVWVSTDKGLSWTQQTTGLSGHKVWRIATHPTDSTIAYAATADNAGIYKTSDGGASWRPVSSGIGAQIIDALAIDPLNSDTLLATARGSVVLGIPASLYITLSGGE